MADSIADMLIRIKNAQRAHHGAVVLPYSRLKENVAQALSRGGYVGTITKKGKRIKKFLDIVLLYRDGVGDDALIASRREPMIRDVARISKQSRRVYQGFNDIRISKNAPVTTVLSTPKGVLLDREARKARVGGEVLLRVWN